HDAIPERADESAADAGTARRLELRTEEREAWAEHRRMRRVGGGGPRRQRADTRTDLQTPGLGDQGPEQRRIDDIGIDPRLAARQPGVPQTHVPGEPEAGAERADGFGNHAVIETRRLEPRIGAAQ